MAKKLVTDLKEELTCSHCKKLFNEPKTLACLHTFCEGCLAEHIQKRPSADRAETTRENFPCPLCKREENLPRDANGVATNMAFKNMVKHLQLEERVRGEDPKCDVCVKEDKAAAFCSTCNKLLCEKCRESHSSQKATHTHKVVFLEDLSSSSAENAPLVTHYTWRCEEHQEQGEKDGEAPKVTFYCKDCEEMMCYECSIVVPHGNHEKFKAVSVVEEHKKDIKKGEQKVEEVQKEFTHFIGEMKELQRSLGELHRSAKEQIDNRLKEIHDQLEKEKKMLVGKVERIFEAKNRRLQEQITELEEIEKMHKDSRKVVNDTLTVGIPEEVLFLKKKFIERMKKLHENYSTHDRSPRENDILQFTANTEFDLSGAIGTVSADPFPPAFTLDGLEGMHFIQGQAARLTVTCRDIAGTPRPIKHDVISVKLCHSATNQETLPSKVEKNVESGVYTVEIEPTSDGAHELSVSVGNKQVPIRGSPFSVSMSRPPLGDISAENVAISGLENPWGVAVKQGKRRVVREGGVGAVREGEGGDVREGGGDGVREGEGAAAAVRGEEGVQRAGGEGEQGAMNAGTTEPDTIVITDIKSHRVAVITNNNFQSPKWIGKEGGGEGDGEFNSPRGVAFNKEGDIVVVEKENCRVQVVSVEGKFQFKFGKKGSGNGEFKRPTAVVIDAAGTIYISDTENNRIQYFKSNGKFQGVFGAPGTLSDPYALTCDQLGRIIVTERTGSRFLCFVSCPPDTGSSDDSSTSAESTCTDARFELSFKSDSISQELLGIVHHRETNYTVVTENNKHRISILDRNGHVLGRLGKLGDGDNEFKAPVGVAVMSDSRVIVCDCGNGKIMLFAIV